MVAEIVAGERRVWDKVCIPAICFTDPEIVTFDLSLEEVRATGIEINTGYFPFQANGRAMTWQMNQASSVSWPGPTITYCSAFREWVLALRSCRQPSAWRSKCVRGSRTLQRRSMPIRPRAKASRGPLSRLWVIRSTYKRLSSMALGGGISMKWRHGFAPLGNQGSAGTSQPLAT